MKRVGFTGHRVLAAGKGGQSLARQHEFASKNLSDICGRAILAGAEWMYSGGARGWDIEFINCALRLRGTYGNSVSDDGIMIGAYIPYPAFWDSSEMQKVKGMVDFVLHVNENPYAVWKMHERNQMIVDTSDAIISVYDGRKSGGTFRTLSFARRKGVPIYWIDPVKRRTMWITNEHE